MNAASQIETLENMVEALISAEPQLFLVELKVRPTNNIKVFIDGDQGVSIEKLVHYNRRLYKELEESGLFPGGDFSLELSSPGLDEPLKLFRQYQKNIGRHVEVTEKDGVQKTGKLISAAENEIVVEEERGKSLAGRPTGKKKEIVQYTIPFENIKSTKIQIKF